MTGYVCTVISLIPLPLHEEKPHLLPSVYDIPAAPDGGMSLLHVGEAIFYIPNPVIEEGKPNSSFKQIVPPYEIARSICEDYNVAHIALGENAQPGLFWLEGRLSERDVKTAHAIKLAETIDKQKNWFHNLVAMAETDWQKNKNLLAVSDLQRAAARILNVKADWIEMRSMEWMSCPYCKTQIDPESIKCANCKEIVNSDAYNKLRADIEGVKQ